MSRIKNTHSKRIGGEINLARIESHFKAQGMKSRLENKFLEVPLRISDELTISGVSR